MNDKSLGTHNANSDIRFKTSMMTSNLYYYRDSYIHIKETITVPDTSATTTLINN